MFETAQIICVHPDIFNCFDRTHRIDKSMWHCSREAPGHVSSELSNFPCSASN